MRWTSGQQVERSILHQGKDSYQHSSHQPRLSPALYSLTVQNRCLKRHSIIPRPSIALLIFTAQHRGLNHHSFISKHKIIFYITGDRSHNSHVLKSLSYTRTAPKWRYHHAGHVPTRRHRAEMEVYVLHGRFGIIKGGNVMTRIWSQFDVYLLYY